MDEIRKKKPERDPGDKPSFGRRGIHQAGMEPPGAACRGLEHGLDIMMEGLEDIIGEDPGRRGIASLKRKGELRAAAADLVGSSSGEDAHAVNPKPPCRASLRPGLVPIPPPFLMVPTRLEQSRFH